jgi:hypothetical protein
MFPSSHLFVTTMMLMEFTSTGQVIPTRLDVIPFKMSPLATSSSDTS